VDLYLAVYLEKFVAYVDLRLAEWRRCDAAQSPRERLDHAAGGPTSPRGLTLSDTLL